MKTLGYMFLIGGFLVGAFAASMETIEWPWFALAIADAALGVFLIKRAAHAHARSDEVLHGNRRDLEQSLANIVSNLGTLKARKTDIPTYEMRFEIDKLFRDDLIRFAEAREAMMHLYGIQAYADVMSEFAAGERYINRVWSASADGYVDEVLSYVDKAEAQFEHARKRLEVIQAT